jgi:hypothetical protein
MLTYKHPKAKTCEVCERVFVPDRMGQLVCRPACAMARVRQAKKAERATTRARKEAIKTIADLKREAQQALNRWIVHVRDKGRPCISCGRHHQGAWHAGHYLSRGAAPQHALNPINVWKQCAQCNTYLHGNQAAYRIRLVELIGLEKVEELESDNTPHKWQREELIAIRDEYRAKLKDMKEGA